MITSVLLRINLIFISTLFTSRCEKLAISVVKSPSRLTFFAGLAAAAAANISKKIKIEI